MQYNNLLGYNLIDAIELIESDKKIEIINTYGLNRTLNTNLEDIRIIQVLEKKDCLVLKVGFF
ncbi:hypothetical protein [Caloranaerobacter azorensis]|uniref:Uncharacterized protein n=2 Tax=Caloranaerobacter azorensis TaxID=116090 RepID=A0A1M5VED2_9FIRM|nr:hypothetical protein [Caloranaerobacter azorensis]QIB26162.1 hypothetical protein G3A45_01855 [Caloranaerobacter azorensis]SHH73576.1 hypothetical protein SAMN02745135_01892 [Caloranaerobacter azorensis DSM 13643]